MKSIYKHLKCRTYGIKQRIYTEGEEGDAFYLILNGRVGLYVNTKKEGKIRLNNIAELKEGDSFGESGLLYGSKHISSAITTTNVELMVLTKDDYNSEFKADELIVQNKILNFYKKHPVFIGIPEEKLLHIAKKTKKATEYMSSDVVYTQGATAEFFYFLARGRVKVVKRLDFKRSKTNLAAPTARDYEYKQFESKIIDIEELSKGSVFGAYEALKNLPYNNSVICTMPCSLYKISLQDLRLLDYYETQNIISNLNIPVTDNDIRSQYFNDTAWKTYRNGFIDSVRKEKKFKERFNFRMPPVKLFKGRSYTPENIFSMPKTHLKLIPIEKIVPMSRSVMK
jgi:CRP-like cAMP-binding protein